MKAILIGGPEDGKTGDFLGSCYVKKMTRSRLKREYPVFGRAFSWSVHYVFYDAIYEWEYPTKPAHASYDVVGRFLGYFLNGKRVNKRGYKI